MMDERHAYWLAALIDGEGSIVVRQRSPGGRKRVEVQIANNHLGLILLAKARIGAGSIYTMGRDRRETHYQVRVQKAAEVEALLVAITPLLVVKQARAIEGLQILAAQREPYKGTHGTNGRFVKIT